jgi:peptidoglycan-N-acetylglucosamine deacetylase
MTKHITLNLLLTVLMVSIANGQTTTRFQWPDGKTMAISLTFDDARVSQVDTGTAVLDAYNVKATFFVMPGAVERRLDGWKATVKAGHEIGNHTSRHPCAENFAWSRQNALENYSLSTMKRELQDTNDKIKALLGVTCTTFAYPCGQKYVGKGRDTKSYVPLIATMFTAGRGWMDEASNDPQHCNFAQLSCYELDGKDFSDILPLIETARANGSWLILGGHEIGISGAQTTKISTLRQLIAYAQDPANGIWLQPMGVVAGYVKTGNQ